MELRSTDAAHVEQEPDGTYVLTWEEPHHVSILLTLKQLQDLISRSMFAQIDEETRPN